MSGKWRPNRALYLAFSSLFVITLAAALASTSLSIALPTIAHKLHLSNIQAFWLGTSTAITSTVIQPGCAPLTHAMGQKAALSASVAILCIGSLLGSAAHDFLLMITARCVQGLGIGAITAVTEIVVTDMIPLRLRGKWLALISVAWAVGTVSGPLLGGLLAETTDWSWRLIFALIVPICLLALVMCVSTLKPRPGSKAESVWFGLQQVDWVGFMVFSGSIISFLVAITQARIIYAWTDYRTILPLTLGSLGLAAFAVYELYFATNAMIPPSIFTNRSCIATFFGTTLHGLVLWCLLYYLPLYYEAVRGFTPLQSGVAILPETASLVPASVITGLLITWTGRYRWAIWAGWAVTAAGTGSLYVLDVDTPTTMWAGLNVIVGLGTGMLFGSMGFAVQASVSHELLPVAVTLYSFFRSLGAAVGVAIGGAIFQNEMEWRLRGANFTEGIRNSAETPENSLTLISGLREMPNSVFKSGLVSTIASSLQTIWVAACITSGVALGACFLIRRFSLDTDLADRRKGRPDSDAESRGR